MSKNDEQKEALLKMLEAAGLSLDDAKAQLRTVSKEAADEKARMFAGRKESNREAVIELAQEVRAMLETKGADLLPGSHLSFTVRVKESGIIATANDCHAAKVIEAIHVDKNGTPCFGADGAEQAKNVRARRKSA